MKMTTAHKTLSRISLFGLVLAMLFAALPVSSSAKISEDSSLWSGYREPLSAGVQNTLHNALCMYNTFWTPLSDISAWGTSKETARKFIAGHTYRGIPYGQPVHKGGYVGTTNTLDDFIAMVQDPESPLYTTRGENTWYYTDHGGPIKYSPYLSNDCSGFVSAAMGIKRYTTAAIGANPDLFPVIGQNLSQLRPGDLLNSSEGGHVIMVYDVVYNHKGGKVQSVVTIEQTPDIIVMRSFGKGGANGSLADLQNKIYTGRYYICRYVGIDDVKPMQAPLSSTPRQVNCVCEPSSVMTVDGKAAGNAYVSFSDASFRLEGWTLSLDNVTGFEYTVYDAAYSKNEYRTHKLNAKYCEDITAPVFGFDYFSDSPSKVNYYSGDVSLDGVNPSDLIDVFAVTDSGRTLVATLTLQEKPSSRSFETTIDSFKADYDDAKVKRASFTVIKTLAINGWCASDGIIRFELKTDDGLWYPLGQYFREDVWTAVGYYYPKCRECNAFNCAVDFSSLPGNSHTVTLRAVLEDGGTFTVLECSCSKMPPIVPALIAGGSCMLACGAAATVFFIVRKKKKQDPGPEENT